MVLGLSGSECRDIVDQQRGRERLHGLPAIEWIGVLGREHPEIVRLRRGHELHRGGEAAIE